MSKLGGNNISNQPLTFDDTLVNNGRLKIEIDYSPTSGANISHTSLQDIGANTHAQIDTHIADTANPHATTASQIPSTASGNLTATNVQAALVQLTQADDVLDIALGDIQLEQILQNSQISSLQTGLTNRLRVDTAAQGLNSTQKTNAKTNIDLQNADNTSDANKPISTATQTALNLKYDASNPSGYQTAAQVTSTVSAASTVDRDRANHTGTQLKSTISDFAHTHPLSDLTQSSATTGQVVRWNGTAWAPATPVSGVTDHTLLTNIGTNTHAQIDAHIVNTSNPHATTAAQVGAYTTAQTDTLLSGKANLAGGNVITGTQDFSNGTIVFDSGGETRFGIGGYTDPDPGTQYNIKYGGTSRSMAVRGQSFFLDQMGIGAQTPVSSAKLQINSTTQGFLPPRMTSVQRLAISSPVPGLMVYDTDLCCICTFAETRWIFECDVFTTSIQSSTSTTYANITQLVTSSLEPGLYVFTLRGIAQSTTGTTGIGFRLAQNTATVSNVNISWTFSQAGAGTNKDYEYSQISLADNVSSTGVVAANINFPISGDGIVRISATGALAVQIRSENGTSVSVRPDTSLVLRKVCE